MRLTLPQQDVYFEQLLYPNEPIYNIGAKIAIRGNIQYEILNQAYIALINQHDAYRSIIIDNCENGELQILPTHNSNLGFKDFSTNNDADILANQYMQEAFITPFDLRKKELLHKFILIKVDAQSYYLFSVYHHIITDGWGTSLMFQRLVSNYNELIEHGQIQTQYPYSYENFVDDDENYHKSDDFLANKEYWTKKFEKLPTHLFEKIDDTIDINKSKRKEVVVKRTTYNRLETLAKQYRSSTFHIILGILYLYFGRKHQNEDFAIGLPVLNRSKSIFKKTVGLFMGVNALRMQLDFENTFEELILNIRQQLRQDYRHQRFPLGKLVQELRLFEQKNRLFDITLSYEKQNYAGHFKNTETRVIPLTHQSERVALAIYIREFDEKEDVKIDFDYNINFFNENSIQQVAMHFEKLIEEININPQKKLSEYQYITSQEEKRLLHSFNQTEVDYPKDATLLTFFKNQVEKRPYHPAIQDKTNVYSYEELDALSNRVANYLLRNYGVGNQSPIAVLMERSADLVVILLGVLKSGRPYIPLDPSFPKERLRYILKHSEVECIIGEEELQSNLRTQADVINVYSLLHSDMVDESLNLVEIRPSRTAYVIYTSGSTGKPKGVVIGHQSLLNFLLSIQEEPKIDSRDVLFSVTTQSFDISILEFFVPLISGATLHVAGKEILNDPLGLIKEIKQIQPTIIQATPSFYQMLFNAGWEGEKELKVLCGGDLLSESLAKNLLQTCSEVWNMYGPTETTIWSSIKKIEKPEDASNIGKAIHNTQFYILDKSQNLLPEGIVGDIYIGGDGLAKGYFKNKSLTSQKFIRNPFQKKSKIYNTGDIGRWNDKGEIEFFGRNDNQVKIRGYRIELGEIETKLNDHYAIKSSVVIAKKSKNQEAALVAYVIPDKDEIEVNEILGALREELPDYMIPGTIVSIKKFPLTPNKKIDRKALTQLEIGSILDKSKYKKPTTDLEIKLCKYYGEVLKIDTQIGIEDNFFRLGGHSLNAVRLIGKIEKNLGYQISLKTIFDHPTVQSLTSFLKEKESQNLEAIPLAQENTHYPITLPQYAIWLASFQSEKSVAYNMFRSYNVEGKFDLSLLEEAFKKTIEKYEALRTNFLEIDGSPCQVIKSNDDIFFKADHFIVEDSKLKKELETYANHEFDLKKETLIRLGLFETTKGYKTLLFVTHHIIMDGWSLEVLIKEVVDSYGLLIVGSDKKRKKPDIQFKDYATWQHKIEQESKPANRKFWKDYLNNYKWESLISYDKDESLSKKFSGSFYHFNWDKMFLNKLNETALSQKITLHTLLATTFNVLIHKMQKLDDICIGTINSGRPFSDLHSQIGMFVKTLPLRSKIHPDQLISDFFEQVQKDMLAIDEHQDIPEDILSKLRVEAILVLQNPTFNYEKIEVSHDFVLKFNPVNAKYSRLPLLFSFSINEKHLNGSVYYDTSKYETATIELLTQKFKKTLEAVINNPFVSINELDIALDFEKQETIEIDFSF
ncbi:amino acid adenylation domain-containing protein [Aquimarina gracilis]|uniref:Amino acid adenylation domain-containing protein n=1 Tax=Aquimarina gracilis TaxID=874422 RepID=A0ABU5ZSB9_9FLAO|nr:amino acid adenylation domain-containing protein [Aquimarina gracilis]MEB3344955.1 amino acid adenylation domain-containing protein [Aquimarina gracilis]